MKKQNKVIIAISTVLVIAAAAVISLNPSLLQGRLSGDRAINNAEFAKMLVVSSDLEITESCDTFTDVPEGVWYESYACTLYKHGVLTETEFNASGSITRSEASKLIHSAFEVDYACTLPKLFRDLDEEAWYFSYVNELAAKGLYVSETPIGGKFKAEANLSLKSARQWFSQSSSL